MVSDIRLLFSLWLRAPLQIATTAPSGRAVCDALIADARRAAAREDGHIVELGAGTGPITRALLEAGIPPERLLAVESNPALYRCLGERFPPGVLACHDATRLGPLFDARGIDRVAAVVSTLPILNFEPSAQRAVLDGCFERAGTEASFVQITYLPGSPIRQRRLRAWGYQAEQTQFIWSNLPPSRIWRYHRRDATAV